jgi:hypothetical protein
MMNKLDTLLKKLIPYIILLFIMALVLKYTLNVGIKVQYILIALSTYCFTLLILMVFMRIVASDILRASLRNMFVLYYISLVLCFAGFVYIRYIIYIPGYAILMAYPGIFSLFMLVLLTLIGYVTRQKNVFKKVRIPWGFLLFTILLVFICTKYF